MSCTNMPPVKGAEDMTSISDLNEDTIMSNLQIRYEESLIYTYVGSILVAANPYKMLPYFEQVNVKEYMNVPMGELPPHIFAIAESCFRNMISGKGNQACIISGESGAGKTECTKLMLQYLTAVTSSGGQQWVEQQIMESNIILEAFGNATTVRNNNSSRFGKFLEIHFDKGGSIKGAKVQDYLLEQTRIVWQSPRERNYHVFYQLVAGDAEKYELSGPENYHYINQSGVYSFPNNDDKKEFEALRMAMTVLNVQVETQDAIFASLAAILLLGNVEFVDKDGEEVTFSDADKVVIKRTSDLLKISEDGLKVSLESRLFEVRGSRSQVPLNITKAKENRDAMAKTLYSRSFTWIVAHINSSINPAAGMECSFIGVLDIFGFENFEINSFEQLCINFTNEKLQKFFTHFIFSLEQEKYKKEGLDIEHINFTDNQECLDLIEKPKTGILRMLDEECRFPKGSDASFLEKLKAQHGKHSSFISQKGNKPIFGVSHYAGAVSYQTEGFLDKNKDVQQRQLFELMEKSGHTFVKELCKYENISASLGGANEKPKGNKKPTVGDTFRTQLTSLVDTLSKTQPWYIRCLKPNKVKKPLEWDTDMVLDQLRYSGMLETIRIRKEGFPVRAVVDQFITKYRCLSAGTVGDDKAVITAAIASISADNADWQVGKTQVFMRQNVADSLESSRKALLAGKCIMIQKHVRRLQAQTYYRRLRTAVIFLQCQVRTFAIRREFLKTRKAAITIQAGIRGWLARDLAKFLRHKKKTEKEEMERAAKKAAAAKAALESAEAKELAALAKASEAKAARAAAEAKAEAKAEATATTEDITESAAAVTVTIDPAPVQDMDLDNIFDFLNVDDIDAKGFLDSISKDLDDMLDESLFEESEEEMRKREERMSRRGINASNYVVETTASTGDLTASSGIGNIDKSLPMEAFAEQHFNDHMKSSGSTLSMRKKTDKKLSKTEMLQYTKRQLETSLTKIQNAESVTIALSIFKEITKLIENEYKDRKRYSVLQNIIKFGIMRSELRDEIYCQVVKQMTDNPNPDQVERGWQLLALICNAFSPSKDLYKYMQAFIARSYEEPGEIGKLAAWSITTMKSIKMTGARFYPPSCTEMETILACRPFIISVTLIDGTTKKVGLTTSSTATDALTEVLDKIGLPDSTGWSLFEHYPNRERAIRGQEYLADVMAFWDQGGGQVGAVEQTPKSKKAGTKATKAASTTVVNSEGGIFLLKRRVFRNPQLIPTNPVEYHLIYCQAVHDVVHDHYPMSEKVSLQLAGLQCQVLWGDFEESKTSRYNDLLIYLPSSICNESLSKEEWRTKIMQSHQEHGNGKSSLQAKVMYLTAVKQFPLYGSTFFKVKYKGFWSNPGTIFLAVNVDGFKFISIKSKKVIKEFLYADLESWSTDVDDNTITLTLKEGEIRSFCFETNRREGIAGMISSYSSQHRHGAVKDNVKVTVASEKDKNKLIKQLEDTRKALVATGKLRTPEAAQKTGGGFVVATLRKIGTMKGTKSRNFVEEDIVDEESNFDLFHQQSWSYSKSKLSNPLTTDIDGEDVEVAMKMFNSLLIHAGLGTTNGYNAPDDEDHTNMVQLVIGKALEKPSICNELYLQLVKQTTNHPSPVSRINLQNWRFLALTLGVILPTQPEILEYVKMHLRCTRALSYTNVEGKWAAFCQKTLSRTIEKNVRKYPPSRLEMLAVCEMKPIHSRFYFLDNQFRALNFDPAAVTREVVDIVKDRIDLKCSVSPYSIFECFGSLERNMLPHEKVADAIFKWEKYAKSTHATKSLRLTFKQRLFFGPYCTPSDPVEFNLVFHQALDDVVNDRHPVSEEEAVYLAALRSQVEIGDANDTYSASEYRDIVERYMPNYMVGIVDKYTKLIYDEHLALCGESSNSCNIKYLEEIRKWPLYGSTVFEVQQNYSSSLPKKLWLAVNEEGVHILKIRTKEPIDTHPYKSIVNFSPSLRNLMIRTDSLHHGQKFVFQSSQASQIAHLIRDYIQSLVHNKNTKTS